MPLRMKLSELRKRIEVSDDDDTHPLLYLAHDGRICGCVDVCRPLLMHPINTPSQGTSDVHPLNPPLNTPSHHTHLPSSSQPPPLQQVLQTSLVAAESHADTAIREQGKSEKKLDATRLELADARQGLDELALRLQTTGQENRELQRVVHEKVKNTSSL